MTGIPLLRVRTAHSDYLIDQNAGTYTRTRRESEANDLSYAGFTDGEARPYLKIVSSLEEGERLSIVEPDGQWLVSTSILSVEEVEAAA